MSTLRYYESFNNKLDEFVKDLLQTFPDINKDLRMLKSTLTFTRNINIRLPQQVFNEHVAKPFGEYIAKKDEHFFLKHDYEDVVTNLSSMESVGGLAASDVDAMDIIGKLKAVWSDMSAENKEIVWKYLAVLMYLNNKCSPNATSTI